MSHCDCDPVTPEIQAQFPNTALD
uniref:Uncharacterized protein n=1 Tax=Anguilla anguilla TaxID=7936 RepID=A0A0E9UYG4_ANGAN